MALKVLLPPSIGKPKASARAEVLEQALCQELGEEVSVEVASSYSELERRVLAGEVEIVWAPAAVCARIEPSARMILKVVRGGRSTYRSGLVARRDDNVQITRLTGLRAVWVDKLSIGGYLLAADYLRRNGVEPDRAFASQRFLGSHPAVLTAILHKTADVGAITIGGDDPKSLNDALAMHGGPVSKALAVIAITDEAPTDALVFTSKLRAAEVDRIKARLFPADRTRQRSFLYSAMDAEGFEKARPHEYKQLLSLLRPPSSGGVVL